MRKLLCRLINCVPFTLVLTHPLSGITISEKLTLLNSGDKVLGSDKATSLQAQKFNEAMVEWNRELQHLYDRAFELGKSGGSLSDDVFFPILSEIRRIKSDIREAQELWAAHCRTLNTSGDYSLWHHPEGTVYDLISDYGGMECIYLIPPEIGSRKISVVSHIPVPRECWDEFLGLVLSRSGISVQSLSPLIKQLTAVSNTASVSSIVADFNQLSLMSPGDMVCYVFSSSNPDIQADQLILQKFINGESVHHEVIGGKLFLFGRVSDISEILKLYQFLGPDCSKQDFRILTLSKIDASEMMAILQAAFSLEKEGSGLKILPLQSRSDALFVSGNTGDVRKAMDLVYRLEEGIENSNDKVVFWYNVKHSDPEELASILSQVYNVLSVNSDGRVLTTRSSLSGNRMESPAPQTKLTGLSAKPGNFIVDLKTGTLIMVVEKETLPHIKALLKRLDVSKKMIQIEVLLFERKIVNQRRSGLNLLRLGEEVCKKSFSPALSWNAATGILEFLIGNKGSSSVPGYDLAYQFLLAQEDIQINASPSIVTMNQTPATIAIVEEMSILISSDKDKVQYNRAQYGITIKIIPTVNIGDEENGEGKSFITLDTDIMFDTTGKSPNDRPDVTRRHITNHVRIADGETVILGGLRRKNSSDGKDGIPFLGDIPGIGKLFSMSNTAENSTEMFIFITPKILHDGAMKDEAYKEALLSRRLGDSEELDLELMHARDYLYKKRLIEEAKKLTSSVPAFDVSLGKEYDGK
ncbi:MAG: secretin N-terminal domain-containing protein [Victivallaceae bacterium]